MSDAIFWFDRRIDDAAKAKGNAANGDLNQVIRGIDGKIGSGQYRKSDLWSMWEKPLTHVECKSDFALFMRGTTSDLVEAMERDLKKDIRRLAIIDEDCLEIRYVRQKVSVTKTVSIVGIGARDSYWKSVPAYAVDEARRRKGWALLRSYKFEATAEWKEAIAQYQLEERDFGNDLRMFVSIDYHQLKLIVESLRDQSGWL